MLDLQNSEATWCDLCGAPYFLSDDNLSLLLYLLEIGLQRTVHKKTESFFGILIKCSICICSESVVEVGVLL